MNRFLLCLGFACSLIVGMALLAADFSPYTYSEPCPIYNTRTATVGYVRQTVVDIHARMTYLTEGENPTPYDMEWGGSGIVLDQAGRVLTNWHVVDSPVAPIKRDFEVTLFNGTVLKAVFLRADMTVDLGLLQLLDPPEGLWVAVLATYDPVHGQDVLVFGSPRGLRGSVSHGILSALGRTITVRAYRADPSSSIEYRDLIQVDAPINPGNSGGPLTDIWGRVIGLVNCGGSGDGMGFAVSIQTIHKFLEGA